MKGSEAPKFRGKHKISARKAKVEPEGVRWDNVGSHRLHYFTRCQLAVLAILFAIVMWGILFYLPWAYFTYNSFRTTGKDLGSASGYFFMCLVVMGNQVMYAICGMVSEYMLPKSQDNQESIYTFSYSA